MQKSKARKGNARKGASKKTLEQHIKKVMNKGKSKASHRGQKPLSPKSRTANTIRGAVSNKDERLIEGVLQGNAKGFAFLLADDKTQADLFVPASSLNGAIHLDRVLCRLVSRGTKDRGGEAEVIKILERGLTRLVGTFQNNGSFGFLIPDDRMIGDDFFVAKEDMLGAKGGEKVVLEITNYPSSTKGCAGKIVEVLGYPEDDKVDILSIVRKYGLYEEFSPEVLKEADSKPQSVQDEELSGRVDYRDTLIITIDGEDARDLDDAISISKDENDNYCLGVHIADVAHYVGRLSKLDKEAFNRGTSVYFPHSVLPMLPKQLSNGICSLNENVDRLTLTAEMIIDKNGKVRSHRVVESVIKSANRMTYTAVQGILDGDKELRKKYDHLIGMLDLMRELANILRKNRFKRGAVDLDMPESKISVDEKTGKVMNVEVYKRLFSHFIIEEFMLKANETVAEWMFKNKMPFVYRVHENPSPEKIETLSSFVETFGLSLNISGDEIRPHDLQKLMFAASDKPFCNVVSKIVLRSMQKARYAPQNLGHFGLASKYYCHFTSPIRRYPDLAIHRIIKDFLKNGKTNVKRYEKFVEEASDLSSKRERLADDAEREVDDLKKAEFMQDKIGESFEGVVSGVTAFGVFVELENTCEGLIRLDELPGDNYVLNERLHTLQNKKHRFKLGDKLNIIVLSVDKEARRTLFTLDEF